MAHTDNGSLTFFFFFAYSSRLERTFAIMKLGLQSPPRCERVRVNVGDSLNFMSGLQAEKLPSPSGASGGCSRVWQKSVLADPFSSIKDSSLRGLWMGKARNGRTPSDTAQNIKLLEPAMKSKARVLC